MKEDATNNVFSTLSELVTNRSNEFCEHVRQEPGVAELRNESGDTLLCIAAWQKNLEAVVCLIAAGAAVNASGDCGKTPLHYAVYEGDPGSIGIVSALLAAGADPDIMDDFGYRPADLAKVEMTECLPEVLVLLDRDNLRDRSTVDKGPDALYYAVRCGDLTTIYHILDKDPDAINLRNRDGNSPLHMACEAKQPHAVTLLVDAGANVNARNIRGCTPLLIAVEGCNVLSWPIVRVLLAGGADPRISDGAGRNPVGVLLAQAEGVNAEVFSKTMRVLEESTQRFCEQE
ncbi:ankyrin repeat domain-containing protein [Aquisphaera insulae]|uniref:ankyrin repeat domain-containing protein n=1 Tax=Aquisphaera insulae TaxID=2712864 RepID=UPI0013E9D71B|nr:ankyrin repeat domain-containing protein [Aquisphaera insulae]